MTSAAAAWPLHPSAIGRDDELAQGQRIIGAAATGPAALVVEGDAGIGKTTLLGELVNAARQQGFSVLSCRPTETEATLAYAALADLLEPVSDQFLDELPAPQRRALTVALLRADPEGTGEDWRGAAMGFLGVLTALARTAPVVVSVDDAQWLDRASARVLEFAARRLGEAHVALLASTRPLESPAPFGLDRALPAERILKLDLGPLSVATLYRLVRDRLGKGLDRALLVRLHESSGGNPMYALELALALERAGASPGPGEALPVPSSLAELVAARLETLRPEARPVLLAVAAAANPSVELVTNALGTESAALLDQAASAGVVEVLDGKVRFSHPLFASAVYAGAEGSERRRVHRRLADAAVEIETRARHSALGTESPDEGVARSLVEAASRAQARGAPDDAAELAELSARLTPDDSLARRVERMVIAAEYAFLAGNTIRAATLLDEHDDPPTPALRARALVLRAQIAWQTKGGTAAVRACEEALVAAEGDPALEAGAHTWAAEFSDFDEEERSRHARAALSLLERLADPDPGLLAPALKAFAESELVLGRGLPMDAVERASRLERERRPQRVTDRAEVAAGWWLVWTDDLAAARPRLEAGYQATQEEGDESSALQLSGWLRELELRSGDLEAADRWGRHQLELAEQLGAERWRAATLGRNAMVDAYLGRVESSRDGAEAALRTAETHADDGLELICVWALGFLELSLQDNRAAESWLARADAIHERIGLREPGYARFHADHVEALVALGRVADAGDLLERLEQRARAVDRASVLAATGRCRALLAAHAGDSAGALRALDESLAHHARVQMPFELARTLLTEGRVRRRFKEKRAAQAPLEQALAIFEELGTPLWAAQARTERGRLGLRRTSSGELSETEQRVAELAASGLRNREIAAQAFLTPKSVEDVLARVYRKLGIRSRAELGGRMAERRSPD